MVNSLSCINDTCSTTLSPTSSDQNYYVTVNPTSVIGDGTSMSSPPIGMQNLIVCIKGCSTSQLGWFMSDITTYYSVCDDEDSLYYC